MKCPACGHPDNRVLETRMQKDGGSIRRRRECLECSERFTTVESYVLNLPYVVKKDGRREPFDRAKIMKGIQLACLKRPISLSHLELVVDRISAWALSKNEKEIQSRDLGSKVMTELKVLDDVAYIRFASVYRSFRDVHEFVQSLDEENPNQNDRSKTTEPSL